MNIGKVLRDAVFVMASAGVAGLIVVCSTERYEGMIGEVDPDGSRLTLCSIPTDPDSSRMLVSVVMLIPALMLAGISARPVRRRYRIAISLAVLALWLYCFFVRFAGCAA